MLILSLPDGIIDDRGNSGHKKSRERIEILARADRKR
jgi:hypothetical protein